MRIVHRLDGHIPGNAGLTGLPRRRCASTTAATTFCLIRIWASRRTLGLIYNRDGISASALGLIAALALSTTATAGTACTRSATASGSAAARWGCVRRRTAESVHRLGI